MCPGDLLERLSSRGADSARASKMVTAINVVSRACTSNAGSGHRTREQTLIG